MNGQNCYYIALVNNIVFGKKHHVSQLITHGLRTMDIDFSISFIESQDEFQRAWNERRLIDIVFLGICPEDEYGFELAQRIRERDSSIPIIFVAHNDDRIDEGYYASAVHYLVVPLDESNLYSVLRKALRLARSRRDNIVIGKTNGVWRYIEIDNLVYVRTCSTIIAYYDTLSNVLKRPAAEPVQISPRDFVRIGDGVYVHKRRICTVKGNRLWVDDVSKTELHIDSDRVAVINEFLQECSRTGLAR